VTARHPATAWLLGWLVPGGGHLYLGRRAQGTVLLVTLTACFAAGVLFGRGRAVTSARPEFLVLQAGAGLPAAAAFLASGGAAPDATVAEMESATLYTVVPALLNLVVALDAAARAARTRAGRDIGGAPPAPGDGAAPAPAPVPAPVGDPA